ncbi:MAG: hypothetical protein ACI87E_002032, partial [Mariniblastus sp.]
RLQHLQLERVSLLARLWDSPFVSTLGYHACQ